MLVTAAGEPVVALAAPCLCTMGAQDTSVDGGCPQGSQMLASGSASLSEQEENDNESTNE